MSRNRGNESDSNSSSIEQTYQKKTPLEHILLRPDTYIGSTEMQEQRLWVWDTAANSMVLRTINYVPGLFKIFDEILVNAADNYQRDKKMNRIKVTIDSERGFISVWNNGKGIPIAVHQEYGIYVPELIFGHLLTSSNYDDTKKKVTGGRNGYGAKLANVFSKKFIVETADSERQKKFRIEWSNNMSAHSEPEIKTIKTEDYTCVTFYPDFPRFGMRGFDKDTMDLLTKRVYDMAGCSGKNVKVYLNDKEIPVKTFGNYVDLYIKDATLPKIFEIPNERWEVAVTISEGVFQQVSFVNSICTSKGGTHVNHVADQVINAISGVVQKKHKKLDVKPNQIKQQLWIFVNCLIENPCFDSQTKENMTLKQSAFGSKCELSEKFIKEVVKCGIIEQVIAFAKAKTEAQLKNKVKAKKTDKLFIPKLEDANDAGTKRSKDCTLIVTEGDSAKSLAMAGIEVIGRDKYGVFPLKGKLLNVREASHKQLMGNDEIQNIMKIIGIQPKQEIKDLSQLRYGSLMIMTDQDMDGSHIKGLLINFIHFFWPDLIKMQGFLKEFITPIVKVTKGNEVISFYTIPEYETWVHAEPRRGWTTKYYKGLGTSTNKEAQEYFSNLARHQIEFIWTDDAIDGDSIDMAFNKKRADDRKRWLADLNPDTYLDQDRDTLPYNEFINKELILFSNYDNCRSIPSVIDGLKPGQRKIMFACFKRKLKIEIKVAQLSGYVAEHSAYHHGENSLAMTIVGLAQGYVGSNNLALLQPLGQFGTRNMGGKDVASARYIFTNLAPVTRCLFMEDDDVLLDYQEEEGQRIEPVYYVPTIPLVLVNGAEGIGTGWSTNVPPYNPIEIIDCIQQRIQGKPFESMDLNPWFKGYQGDITWIDRSGGGYELKGKFEVEGLEWLKILELPVKKWTCDYKKFLEDMMTGDNPFITELKEYHTENRVHFEVKIPTLASLSETEIYKKLKLSTTMSMSNLVLFNNQRKICRYQNVAEIMEEHFLVREDFYNKRKEYLLARLTRDTEMLSNKVRFILMVVNGELIVSKKKKKVLVTELKTKGFLTKTELNGIFKDSKFTSEEDTLVESEPDEAGALIPSREYDYLLGMPLWSLTYEKVEELKRDKDEKTQQLQVLRNTSIYDIWVKDLENLRQVILETWENEESERLNRPKPKQGPGQKARAARKPAKKGEKENSKPEAKPMKQTKIQVKKPPIEIKTKSDDESGSLFSKAKALGIFDAEKPKTHELIKISDSSEADSSSDASSSIKPSRKRQARGGGARAKKPKTQARAIDIETVSEIEEDSDFEL